MVKTIHKRQSQVTNAQSSIFRPISIGGLYHFLLSSLSGTNLISCVLQQG